VTDLIGQKVVSADRLKGIEERLLSAASEGEPVQVEAVA